jgi:hypothetical protein
LTGCVAAVAGSAKAATRSAARIDARIFVASQSLVIGRKTAKGRGKFRKIVDGRDKPGPDE